MLTVHATCPDCSAHLLVVRDFPDEPASVIPTRCPGCHREWTALLLQHRDCSGELRYTARLNPTRNRLAATRIPLRG